METQFQAHQSQTLSKYQSIVQTFPYLILTLIWLIIENGTGIPSRTAVKWLGILHVSSNFGSDMWLYLILLTVIYKSLKIYQCRTRRNEHTLDYEPAKEAACKAELTIPSHYGKYETLLHSFIFFSFV